MASTPALVERSEDINAFKSEEDLTQEYEQYMQIVANIRKFESELEGMEYKPSNAEDNFKKVSTFIIVILMFLMIAHQAIKFMRFQET